MKKVVAEPVYKWYCPYASCKDMMENITLHFFRLKNGGDGADCYHCGRTVEIIVEK